MREAQKDSMQAPGLQMAKVQPSHHEFGKSARIPSPDLCRCFSIPPSTLQHNSAVKGVNCSLLNFLGSECSHCSLHGAFPTESLCTPSPDPHISHVDPSGVQQGIEGQLNKGPVETKKIREPIEKKKRKKWPEMGGTAVFLDLFSQKCAYEQSMKFQTKEETQDQQPSAEGTWVGRKISSGPADRGCLHCGQCKHRAVSRIS